MDQLTVDGKSWRWWLYLGLVAYIALIGIFAIEELNGRDETLRVLLAEEARIGAESAPSDAVRAAEIGVVRGLRQRLIALVVSGAVDQPNRQFTLREIQCDLVKSRNPDVVCPQPLGATTLDLFVRGAAVVFLKGLSGAAGSGQVLGVLIVTASIGGALITLSLKRKRRERGLRTVLRAMGGGIVCYLAVDGGSIPLTAVDISRTVSPATASLYGLLAGMFSERVFRLLSDLVRAFLSRLTPDGAKAPATSKPSATPQVDAGPPLVQAR